MYRFLTLTRSLFLVYLRERSTLFWNFAFPIFLLILYGVVFGGDDVAAFMSWTMPGVLTLNLLAFGLIGSSTMMTEFRQTGVLRRLQASPAPALVLVGAYIFVNVAVALLQSALVVGFAVLAYGVRLPAFNLLLTLPMILLAVLMSLALGQVISGLAPGAGGAVALGQILYFGQMFVTDLIIPLEQLPEGVQAVGRWLPGYAMAQLVRPPLQDGVLSPEFTLNLLLTLAYSAAAVLLAARLFRWEARS